MYTNAQSNVIHNNQKCPSTDEWIRQRGSIHTAEHLAIRRNEVLTHATTGVNFENMLGERSSTKLHTLYDYVYMKCPDLANLQR